MPSRCWNQRRRAVACSRSARTVTACGMWGVLHCCAPFVFGLRQAISALKVSEASRDELLDRCVLGYRSSALPMVLNRLHVSDSRCASKSTIVRWRKFAKSSRKSPPNSRACGRPTACCSRAGAVLSRHSRSTHLPWLLRSAPRRCAALCCAVRLRLACRVETACSAASHNRRASSVTIGYASYCNRTRGPCMRLRERPKSAFVLADVHHRPARAVAPAEQVCPV